MVSSAAEKIVDTIIDDLSDRHGIGQEWGCIDDKLQDEIRSAWITLADRAITDTPTPSPSPPSLLPDEVEIEKRIEYISHCELQKFISYEAELVSMVQALLSKLKEERELRVKDEERHEALLAQQVKRADELLRRIAALEKERDELGRFVAKIMEDWPEGGSFDGGDIQDIAVSCGLLIETTMQEPCGEDSSTCACLEYCGRDEWPLQCFRVSDALKHVRARATKPESVMQLRFADADKHLGTGMFHFSHRR